mmetsp:Transcript_24362/g.51411  ORF Transcript_24362/g.51411 Transcript_24362/m.51411 type:complete len:342 (+) Transcript_24362:142-1167(+)|eukprot:CAMPEP_0168181378 /NCGR_PEP_ID=MMETSP0139_2-20121125/11178_1 /TAXON_ID=44445 /ORGANISM="Pseudo-nitzschia australis, Strain 10249 10 AB" /LENGTH=341 /DNA_ID=CAMNT_0008101937 /DNA_START=93 /DNA_END=1118 /DNA_ORIENTATION=-
MSGGFIDGETYLEGLIESLSTLPAEMRRNLELMKDMDGSCSYLMDETMRMQQEYLQLVEEKMGRLEVVDGEGVRVLAASRDGTGGTTTNEEDADEKMTGQDKELPVIIPTTEELMAYVHNPATRSKIETLRADALQQAEEKVAIANQTYELVDNLCRKLDTDLKEMERSLLARNGADFHNHPSAGANGVVPGASSVGASGAASSATTGGRGRGAPKKDDLAAVQEFPGSPDWILAKVITHDPQTGIFKLSDEDMESNKVFNLPESQVIILERMKNLRIGDVVFAVYPDTTSFYQGTIAQPPRKAAGGGMFVMVTFVDDEDLTTGKTLDKAVLLKYVMPPPF